MVYVLNRNGQPLMPTERHGKVRRLLKENKAKVINRCPFVIQLLYETENNTQLISLGVDAGSKHVGISATTKLKELYASEIELRTDITELLSTRREMRRARRNRKTRYRQPRFNNRVKSKHKGWLAPSVENKIQAHFREIEYVHKILPVTNIIVEVASFDLQKLKADMGGLKRPEGIEYQQGDQMGFWNVREYVLWRDNYTCQCCHGKSGDKILNVHHIESRKTGGNSPGDLVTVCETCHGKYHRGEIEFNFKRKPSFRDASFMGIMRWAFYNRLKELYPDVHMTYGYITKNTRIRYGIEKTHCVDARCISGNPNVRSLGHYFYKKCVRSHNRQIHKMTIMKSGIRKMNQTEKAVKGYRLYDVVKAKNRIWYIHGRRKIGAFLLKTLGGDKLEISPRKITFICHQAKVLCERREALPPRPVEDGVPAPIF